MSRTILEIVENIYSSSNGKLVLKHELFDIEGWAAGEAELYTSMLLDCCDRGGMSWGALENDKLVGITILESQFIGSESDTLQLRFLHVSRATALEPHSLPEAGG
jgi:hypothetical protein